MVKMKMLSRMHICWLCLAESIEQLVRDCSVCQEAEVRQLETLNPWVRPRMRIHIGFVGPFFGYYFLVMVDVRSRWPEVHKMTSITASNTIAIFWKVFGTHGLCEVIISDNGPPFALTEFRNFMQSNEMKHIRTPPYSPKTHGSTEKFVRTIKDFMRKVRNNPGDVEKKILNFFSDTRRRPIVLQRWHLLEHCSEVD